MMRIWTASVDYSLKGPTRMKPIPMVMAPSTIGMKVETYRILVEAGADLNTVSGGGTRALAECAGMGDLPGVSYLLSAGAKADLGGLPACNGLTLHMAVSSDKIEVVKLLLDAGADINLEDADCWTCLWWLSLRNGGLSS